jgi:hypothetical protein
MKTVFSNFDLIHTFAQQTQSEGRTSNNSLFFKNNKLYSWGHHYLLCEFIDPFTVIINDKGYSVSTRKHIIITENATRQFRQLFLRDIDLNFVYNEIINDSKKIITARKKDIYATAIKNKYETLKSYLLEFNKENILSDAKFIEITEIYNNINSNFDQYINDAKIRLAKEKEKERIKFEIDLNKFLNHEVDYIYKNNIAEDFLRISIDKKQVQTTQGVKIDINEAKKLYQLIENKVDIKGYKIQNYTVISINGHLKIGCHNINIKNMHEIGQLIKTI